MGKRIRNLRKVRPKLRNDRRYLTWLLSSGDSYLPNLSQLLFYSKGVQDSIGQSIFLIDKSCNDNHIPVVSGTWADADMVVNVPTGHALAGIGPFIADTDVTLSEMDYLADNDVFISERGLLVYSVAQDANDIAKELKYLGGLAMLNNLEMLDTLEMI